MRECLVTQQYDFVSKVPKGSTTAAAAPSSQRVEVPQAAPQASASGEQAESKDKKDKKKKPAKEGETISPAETLACERFDASRETCEGSREHGHRYHPIRPASGQNRLRSEASRCRFSLRRTDRSWRRETTNGRHSLHSPPLILLPLSTQICSGLVKHMATTDVSDPTPSPSSLTFDGECFSSIKSW